MPLYPMRHLGTDNPNVFATHLQLVVRLVNLPVDGASGTGATNENLNRWMRMPLPNSLGLGMIQIDSHVMSHM